MTQRTHRNESLTVWGDVLDTGVIHEYGQVQLVIAFSQN